MRQIYTQMPDVFLDTKRPFPSRKPDSCNTLQLRPRKSVVQALPTGPLRKLVSEVLRDAEASSCPFSLKCFCT